MSPLGVLKFGLLHKPDSIFKLILEVNPQPGVKGLAPGVLTYNISQ